MHHFSVAFAPADYVRRLISTINYYAALFCHVIPTADYLVILQIHCVTVRHLYWKPLCSENSVVQADNKQVPHRTESAGFDDYFCC